MIPTFKKLLIISIGELSLDNGDQYHIHILKNIAEGYAYHNLTTIENFGRYWYYLFIDTREDIANFNFNFNSHPEQIIALLEERKYPAILRIGKLSIYHRSVIHYIYPLPEYAKYGAATIFEFRKLLEYPLNKFKSIVAPSSSIAKPSLAGDQLYRWFYPVIATKELKADMFWKIRDFLTTREKPCLDEATAVGLGKIDINYMDQFDIYRYFNVIGEHRFFKEKAISFHRRNREMWGQCGTYHFAHDFRSAGRNAIINHLIQTRGYKKYLEIGVYNCHHLDDVMIEEKWGVDPSPKKTDPAYKKLASRIFLMTSEEFFASTEAKAVMGNDGKVDIIFIDGCLFEKNIINDINSALAMLNPGGIIVIHDCNPPNEFHQRDNKVDLREILEKRIIWNNRNYSVSHWNGKVWKAIVRFRLERRDLRIRTVDTDWGMGLIEFGESAESLSSLSDLYQFETFVKYRKYILNLITVEEFLADKYIDYKYI